MAQSLMHRMGLVKRKASTKKSKMTSEKFEKIKTPFLQQVGQFANAHTIPSDLVINWVQTGINVVPSSNYTMEERGAGRVDIAGYGDKSMITATFAATLSGKFLPMQILYGGKTNRCHPKHQFPCVFDVYHNPNHWANEECAIRFIKKIILPYVKTTREELSNSNQTAMVSFDVFKGQTTSAVHNLLEENGIVYVHIPGGFTDKLQPLNVSVNKSAKSYLREKFSTWYAEQVNLQLSGGKQAAKVQVDMRLSVMKELSAKWLEGLYDRLRDSHHIIVNGFKEAGIKEAIENPPIPDNCDESDDDPFVDCD